MKTYFETVAINQNIQAEIVNKTINFVNLRKKFEKENPLEKHLSGKELIDEIRKSYRRKCDKSDLSGRRFIKNFKINEVINLALQENYPSLADTEESEEEEEAE